MIVSSTPIYGFISTGELTAMYTLRIMASVVSVNSLGQRETFMDDYYIQNLSTDKQIADDKANSILAQMDIPFRPNADFDLNEIKRRKASEVAAEREAREQAQREYLKLEADRFAAQTTAGFMVCGKYIDKTAQEIVDLGDIDYILFAAREHAVQVSTGPWAVNCAVANEWLQNNPQKASEYVGVVGEKITLELTVRTVRVCHGAFYTVLYVCATEAGDLVKFFTTAKAFDDVEKGHKIKVQGAVKAHEIDCFINGHPKVTMFNRPKMVK